MAPRGVCVVCLRSISLSASGLVHVHGSTDNRCPGSNQQPQRAPMDPPLRQQTPLPQSQPQPTPASQEAPSLSLSPQSAVASPPVDASVGTASGPTQSPVPPTFTWQTPRVRMLRRIPRASRDQASAKLTTILEGVVGSNSVTAWERLPYFSVCCLRVPPRGGHRRSLATLVNKQLREKAHPSSPPACQKRRGTRPSDPLYSLRRQVSTKLEEGDFRGAVRLACSEDSIAKPSNDTYVALRQKHPSPRAESAIPAPPIVHPNSMTVTEAEVLQAVKSFLCGSAGGRDGLRPQHLKDMLKGSEGNVSSLLGSLAAFATLVLEGRVPPSVRPFFFGASLTALEKKGGGVRPIAIGCTLRRLVAKIAGRRVTSEMASLLAPNSWGLELREGLKLLCTLPDSTWTTYHPTTLF